MPHWLIILGVLAAFVLIVWAAIAIGRSAGRRRRR